MKQTSELVPGWVAALRAWIVDLIRIEIRSAVADALRPSEFLTVREAAAFARISVSTVRIWIRSERLVPYRVGTHIRVKREDVERVLREGGVSQRNNKAGPRAPIASAPIPLIMDEPSAAAALKEMRALQRRGWSVPERIKPDRLAEHILERSRLRQLLKETPRAMTPEDLRSLSAEMSWLRWATQPMR